MLELNINSLGGVQLLQVKTYQDRFSGKRVEKEKQMRNQVSRFCSCENQPVMLVHFHLRGSKDDFLKLSEK